MSNDVEWVSRRRQTLALISVALVFAACDALVSQPPPGNPTPSTGMPGTPGQAPDATSGAGVSPVDTPPAPAVDAPVTPPVADAGGAGGKGGSTVDAGGVGGNPGSGGTPGAGGGSANCDYPAGAEDATTTRFPVGSVVPNLKFFREDGSEVTFKDLRCNRKNRLLLWAVGGDLCAPCVARAKVEELPAWKALAGEGLFLLESFCGSNDLVGPMPFPEWRRKTGWPMADMDGIMLVREPQMKPYYVMGRIVIGIPWAVTIDLETMKVVNVAGMGFPGKHETTATLRARLMILPPRK